MSANVLSNTWVLTGRMLKHNLRSMDTIITVVAMPVMIMLAFVFVLGGALKAAVPGSYVNYVVPVVLFFTIASGVAYTAYHVVQDVQSGMFDRLRTMPIAHSSLVGGHIVASVIANAVSVVAVVVVALICGYRPHPGWAGLLVMLGVLVCSLVAFSVMGAFFGLAARSPDGASVFSYLLMGLLFVSSGFAPTDTMPSGLRAFANYQPMTPIIDAVRGAQASAVSANTTLIAFGWLLAVIVVFGALSVRVSRARRVR